MLDLLAIFWPLLMPQAPPVSLTDLGALPPHRVVQAHRATCRQCVEHLRLRATMDQRPEIGIAMHDAQLLAEIWEALDDATGFAPGGNYTRNDGAALRGLERLRHLVGPEAYYGGRMPCPVPVWWLWPE